MRFIRLIIAAFFALTVFNSKAQISPPVGYKLFFEKAYLHTDRETYTGGEDIWFKAYLMNGQSNELSNSSNNLYVELISPDDRITGKKTIRLDNGLGNGDFHLSDSIAPGTYRLRAYTSWMRNFGDNFIFEKTINIYSSLDRITRSSPSKKDLPIISETVKTNLPPALPPIVRFFPEGGSLIDGVAGIVAFKAEDPAGKGLALKGSILSASGAVLTDFACDSSGMGSLMITETVAEQLKASGTFSNGRNFSTNLPAALSSGFSLYIKNTDSLFKVSISTNQATLDQQKGQPLTLLAKSKGKTVYTAQLPLNELQATITISKASLPAGISAITLYNDLGQPQAERLVYVEENNPVQLSLSSNKKSYASKEKVTVIIKTTDQHNNPVIVSLSLAAVDAGLVPVNNESIVSYLNLSSEIKGKINNPNQYFDENNPHRKQQLDLLLLTQGWRDFVWKRLADSALKISYPAEQGLSIAGNVRQVWFNKAIPKLNVTLMIDNAIGPKLYGAQTDSAGKYRFDDLNFSGTQFVRLVSADSKGSKTGWVLVDTVARKPPAILPLPVYRYVDMSTDPTKALLTRAVTVKKLNFFDTTYLHAVDITGGRPGRIIQDSTFTITTADYKKKYSLRDYLLEHVSGAERFQQAPEIVVFYGIMARHNPGTSVMLSFDGRWGVNFPIFSTAKPIVQEYKNIYHPTDQDYLDLPMDKINSVYFKHTRNDGGVLGDFFHIRVDVKLHAFEQEQFNVINKDIKGYDEAREFYAPQYETADTKPDYRTTIHWEPNITTNENGEATVTYYNADPKTKIRIVAEGISDKGVPVTGTAGYEIK